MNLRFAIAMATVSFFNATHAMDADDSKPSFHSMLTFGLKKDSKFTEYPAQIRALNQLTLDRVTDPDDRGCIRFFRPSIEHQISQLSKKLIEAAPINREARMAAIDLDLATPRQVYADVASFYHDAVTKNNSSLDEIPEQERLAALTESRQFFQDKPKKSRDQQTYTNQLVRLHDVHGTLAERAQSPEEALAHWRAVVDIHPTAETRNALINSLLGVAHKKPSQRKELCHEAQHNLAKLTPKVLDSSNPNFRFHTLLKAELCNLNGDYDQTLKAVCPLGDDPCAQMYAAAAHFFTKDYAQGFKAVASACESVGPTPALNELYKRSRCQEAMGDILRKQVIARALEQNPPVDRQSIAKFGKDILEAEKNSQA